MTKHYFGGAWTEIKLEIIQKYLNFYTTALKKQNFKLVYIDGFAGTGSRDEKSQAMPLFGKEEEIIKLSGSARNALETTPPFDKYIFIEEDKKRFHELEKLKNEFHSLDITVINDDANQVLITLSKQLSLKSNKYRGVIFLDPYGLNVNWETLQAIAATRLFDVWFLFSISGLYRQASISYENMEEYKKDCLNKIFGTTKWFDAFYNQKKKPVQGLLFAETGQNPEEIRRDATVKQMEEWVKQRLRKCFPYVSVPKALPEKGAQLFSLFFCVSNDSPKAIGLAQKVANEILKKK